jgi:hypothetical protein
MSDPRKLIEEGRKHASSCGGIRYSCECEVCGPVKSEAFSFVRNNLHQILDALETAFSELAGIDAIKASVLDRCEPTASAVSRAEFVQWLDDNLVMSRDSEQKHRTELATITAERDAAVSIGTQLERELDRLRGALACVHENLSSLKAHNDGASPATCERIMAAVDRALNPSNSKET